MNKNLIGLNAGKVWQLLNNNKRWSYSELKDAVGLSDRDLNAAIGWLAREDKIDFETEGGNDRLFLWAQFENLGELVKNTIFVA